MCSMMHYLMPHHIYRDKFVVRNPDELLLCTEYVLVLLYLKLLPNFGKSLSSPTPSRLVLPLAPATPIEQSVWSATTVKITEKTSQLHLRFSLYI